MADSTKLNDASSEKMRKLKSKSELNRKLDDASGEEMSKSKSKSKLDSKLDDASGKEISKSAVNQSVSQSLISFEKVKLSLRILALHCVLLSQTLLVASSNRSNLHVYCFVLLLIGQNKYQTCHY